MKDKNQYANWWSRLLFKDKFEKQFFIPLPSSFVEDKVFKAIEKYKFNMNLSHLKIDRPVFITGLPRSGTTMLYNLLCAHEEAAFITTSMNACPETLCTIEWLRKKFNFNIQGERFLADSIDVDFGSPSEPILLWGKWFNRDVDSLYWEEQRLKDLPPGKSEEIFNDIRKILFSFGADQERNKRFICKYPLMQTEMRIIQDLFPDARFIHIIRDSRPAANSLVKLHKLTNNQIKKINHPTVDYVAPYPRVKKLKEYIDQFGADDIRTTAHLWNDSIELVQSKAPDLNHYIEVRYEDILRRPEQEMSRLFDFCQLKWPAFDNASFKKEFEKIGHVNHKNDYKDYDLIEEITRPILKKLGYIES